MEDKLNDIRRKMLKDKLQQLFDEDKKHGEDRKGLHGSGIIVSDDQWCYREAILSLNHKSVEVKHSDSLIRIFKHGNAVHDKWQNMFGKIGWADFVEARCYSELWELLSTPDLIVTIDNKVYIGEIKSMNSMSFRKAVKGAGHPSGRKQCILYMYLFGIPNGFVLMENKDTQEYDIEYVTFDLKAFEEVEKFIERLFWAKQYNTQYVMKKILPDRICKKNNEPRAKKCGFCKLCFNMKG